jgi:hypothetical protein
MDPKRLLEINGGNSADALERELLGSLRPNAESRDEVWRRLAAPGVLAIGASAAGVVAAAKASASTGAAATGTTFFSTAKLGLVLALAAPVAAGAFYVASSSPAAPPSAAAPALVATAPSPDKAGSEPAVAPQPPPPAEQEAAQGPAKVAERPAPESAISEENRLLREARTASRSGDAAGALSKLRVLDRRFPAGALLQERELLRVQALRAQGSQAEAEQRARRFLKLYPSSPYASHMKALLNEAP